MDRWCLFSISLLMCVSLPARGAVIIEVESKSISAGDLSAFVDVWITGGSMETIEAFGYQFEITGAIPQSGSLQFSAAQTDSEVGDSSAVPYVFVNDSGAFNAVLGIDSVQLTGGDILASGQDRSIDGTYLLARLELQHFGTLSSPSHEFTISLVPAGSFFEFDIDDDPPVDQPLAFTHISGIITVNSTAVPEPATFGAFALITFAYAGRCARRRKRNAAGSCGQSHEG